MQFTPAEISILQQAAQIILRAQLPLDSLFTVTREWMDANRTAGGAWKAKQLRAIGVSWPLTAGWQSRAEGRQVTQAARLLFQSFAGEQIPVAIAQPLSRACCGCDVLPWETCIHTYGRE